MPRLCFLVSFRYSRHVLPSRTEIPCSTLETEQPNLIPYVALRIHRGGVLSLLMFRELYVEGMSEVYVTANCVMHLPVVVLLRFIFVTINWRSCLSN